MAEFNSEVRNITALGRSKLPDQLVLQLLVFENLHELHNVRLHLSGVTLGLVLGGLSLEVTLQRFHMQTIM
jgi:hypothetical protein